MSEYNIPNDINELFQDMGENGSMSYTIIDYETSYDNNDALTYFLEQVGVLEDNIILDEGTRATLYHPDYSEYVIIDSGGLGDFYSHVFDCRWEDEV